MSDGFASRRDGQGRFVHPWDEAGAAQRSLRDLLRWQWQRLREGRAPLPPRDAFRTATPAAAQPRAATGELRITWVGHATFLLQLGPLNILTDPVWSRRASPLRWAGPERLVPALPDLDALPPIDVVIISHDHYDHLDDATVRRLHERHGSALQWVTPLGYADWLGRRGIERVVELDWWQAANVDVAGTALEVTAAPTQHWSKRSPFSERERLWASFRIAAPAAGAIFFCGDSGYFEGFREIGRRLGPFDASLLPVGAYEPRWFMKGAHMNPEEAVRVYEELGGAGAFVAMHWGTFQLTDEPALEPPQRTRAAWQQAGLPAADLWILRHGETRVHEGAGRRGERAR